MSNKTVDTWITAFGAAHHGAVCARRALRDGIGYEALRTLTENGRLVRLAVHVYRLRDHPLTWETRLWASIFEAGLDLVVVSHRSAGRLHELHAYEQRDDIEVTRRRGGDHDITLGRLHETSLLDADHVTVIKGFPCTTLARTLFDLCGSPDTGPLRTEGQRTVHRRRMQAVVNDAIRRHGLTVEGELAVLAAIGRRGRPGTALVRELFEEMGCRYTPTESELETLFVELVANAGLKAPDRQVRLGDHDGFIGRVDFLWREEAVAVEIDSRWHDGPLDIKRDAERDRRLTAMGFSVLRFRWRDLVLTPEKVARKLRTALGRSEPAAPIGAIGPIVTAHSVP